MKFNRRFKWANLLVGAALFTVQSVVATPLTFDGFKWGSVTTTTNTNSPLDAPLTTQPATGGLNVHVGSGTSFEAWCMEVWQWLGGSDYTYQSSILGITEDSGKVMFTQAKIDNLSRLASAAHASINSATTSAAFQAAIWEIAFENSGSYDLSAGAFTMTAPSSVTGQASTWLNDLGSYSAGNYSISAWTSPTQQDALVFTLISEPKTYLILLTGLVLLGFAVRRRTFRKNTAPSSLSGTHTDAGLSLQSKSPTGEARAALHSIAT